MTEQEREALPPLPIEWRKVEDADGIEVPVFRAFQMRDYARAALAAKAVPAGWKLVPEKPTPAMIEALRVATRRDWPSDEVCCVRYAAMLAAAPTHEESSVDADAAERRCGGPGCDGNCCLPAPEATPAPTPTEVWEASSKTGRMLFPTEPEARAWVAQFPASVAGGFEVYNVTVYHYHKADQEKGASK